MPHIFPDMFNIFEYDFGYSWFITFGFTIPLIIGGALAGLAAWRRWRPWVTVLAGIVIVWSSAALYVGNVTWGLNRPMDLPTA